MRSVPGAILAIAPLNRPERYVEESTKVLHTGANALPSGWEVEPSFRRNAEPTVVSALLTAADGWST
jgi:hypothetical protein